MLLRSQIIASGGEYVQAAKRKLGFFRLIRGVCAWRALNWACPECVGEGAGLRRKRINGQ